MVVTGIPIGYASLFMRRRAAEAGAAPGNGVAVERREAPPPTSLGAERLVSVPGGPIARLAQGRSRKPPAASRRSLPSRGEGRKKGVGRARVHKNGPAELWLYALCNG